MPKLNLVRNDELDAALTAFAATRLHNRAVDLVVSDAVMKHARLAGRKNEPFADYTDWKAFAHAGDDDAPEAALKQLVAASPADPGLKELIMQSPILPAIASNMRVLAQKNLDADPFVRNFKAAKPDGLKYEIVRPSFSVCETSLYGVPKFLSYGLKIPRICMYSEQASFPAVSDGKAILGSVTAIETETVLPAAGRAHGNVLCCGAGIGHYAYLASVNPDVDRVTVVESDPRKALVFLNLIRPMFPDPDKVSFVQDDPCGFLADAPDGEYDSVFVRLWEGFDCVDDYFRARAAAEHLRSADVEYWLEDAILAGLFDALAGVILKQALEWPDSPLDGFTGLDRLAKAYDDAPMATKRAARCVCDALKTVPVDSSDGLKGLFTVDFLRDLTRTDKFEYKSPYRKG